MSKRTDAAATKHSHDWVFLHKSKHFPKRGAGRVVTIVRCTVCGKKADRSILERMARGRATQANIRAHRARRASKGGE